MRKITTLIFLNYFISFPLDSLNFMFTLDYDMREGQIAPLWEYEYFNSMTIMSSTNLKSFA